MGVADTLIVNGICKIQPFDSKSIATKLEIPKLLSLKPRSDVTQIRCLSSSSSSSSRFSPTPDLLKKYDFDFGFFATEFFSNVLLNNSTRQLLSVMIAFNDEDEQLKIKFDHLAFKAKYEMNLRKKANIVLDEVLPLLLENAQHWISSFFTVSSDLEESCDKLRKCEEMIGGDLTLQPNEENPKMGTATIKFDTINTVRCTKVFVDVSVIGGIDDKFKEIHTREDLKTLLSHLKSIEGVTNASVLCARLVASKKALEDGFQTAS